MTSIKGRYFRRIMDEYGARGPTKVLAESRINTRDSHLVFQNEAKNILRQDFMVMNMSCKFEKASYNIFFRYSSNSEISLHTTAAGA